VPRAHRSPRRARPPQTGLPFVLVRGRSCLQSRQRGVAGTYPVFDMPTICPGS
jgi:hypothetical protein